MTKSYYCTQLDVVSLQGWRMSEKEEEEENDMSDKTICFCVNTSTAYVHSHSILMKWRLWDNTTLVHDLTEDNSNV